MKDLVQEFLDDGTVYQEWSEIIEQQNRQQQDAEMVIGERYTMEWDEVRTIEREFRVADPKDYRVVDIAGLSWGHIMDQLEGLTARKQ